MTSSFSNINPGDANAAAKDVQERLCKLDLLNAEEITGTLDQRTIAALNVFCEDMGYEKKECVDEELWGGLIDATYSLGERSLYLRVPQYRGNDCRELQHVLGTLGFPVGDEDGFFGVNTEGALRLFQQNMGLPSDGICGALTYQTIRNLHHSWEGKNAYSGKRAMSLARMAEVLENNTVCLFGTCDFTRSVAKRMSNLSLATTPQSKIVSADALSVPPDETMILMQVVLDGEGSPAEVNIDYSEDDSFAEEIERAINEALAQQPKKFSVTLSSRSWAEAKEERSAQHYAINLLDSLCNALSHL